MKQIAFNIDLKINDLYAFTMRHTYYSISGAFSLLISFGSLIACAVMFSTLSNSTRVVLLIVGLLFTVVQPIMLYLKCKKQIKVNESINAPLQYILSDDGICICQKDNSAEVKWYEIRKVVYAKKGIYLYMSPIRAFIFPEDQCGKDYPKIKSMVAEQVSKYKNYESENDENLVNLDNNFEEDEEDEE